MSWRRLLHRWFVEYNPLYLLSAALVLGGTILLSDGIASSATVAVQIGVAAVSDLYALALIGGAALLMRIGQRRPAVMLALLTVLYQCDLTLHTEACANFGPAGVAAALGWLALFAGKLALLARAMRVRLSRRSIAVAMLGAVGLALLPHVLAVTAPRMGTAIVVAWWCALAFLHRSSGATSVDELDPWGQTVLRRTQTATWLLWALLLVLHVLFWSAHHAIDRVTLLLVLPLLGARWIRSELVTWGLFAATLALGVGKPASFSLVTLVGAVTLAHRARTVATTLGEARLTASHSPPSMPYRVVGPPAPEAAGTPELVARLLAAREGAYRRLLTGAACALHLSIWTTGWSEGPFPQHVLWLDIGSTVALALLFARTRAGAAIAAGATAWLHFLLESGVVTAHRSAGAWGVIAVGGGFALLCGSLVASYVLREVAAAPGDSEASTAGAAARFSDDRGD